MTSEVVFALPWLPKYRKPFFNALRAELAERSIRLTVVYGTPDPKRALRDDVVDLEWGRRRPNVNIPIGGRYAVWQRALGDLRGADLIVLDPGARLLLNHWLFATRRRKLAFWGHDENLNRHRRWWIAERIKRSIALSAGWWFVYTPSSASRLIARGFPGERVTVAGNSCTADEVRREIKAISPGELEDFRRRFDLPAGSVGLFLGSLYRDKRLDFLIETAHEVHLRNPDFRLVVAGDGADRALVEAAAAARGYVRFLGRVDRREKALALAVADVMFLPGAVGLAVVDAFAAGLPVLTTPSTTHGPEIEFLEHDGNGLIVPNEEFASAALRILEDHALSSRLREGAKASGERFSVSEMSKTFAAGIEAALACPRR